MIKNRSVFITSMEAAGIIGVTQDHVRRLILEGKIKAQKLGPNWVINRKDLKGITRQRFPRKKEKGTRLNGSD